MKNIAIDSDVIVASEIDTESNHKKSKEFMEQVLANKVPDLFFFTSIFTFLELASAMIRRTKSNDKTYSLLYRITKSWKKVINPLPLSSSKKQITPSTFSRDLIDGLIETAIRFNTKSGDTIQSQAILENQIDCFVTWNKKDFLKLEKEIKDFRVLSPLDFINEIETMELSKKYPRSFQLLLQSISSKSKLPLKEIESKVIAKREKLSGLVSYNGAAEIVAAELGVKLDKHE